MRRTRIQSLMLNERYIPLTITDPGDGTGLDGSAETRMIDEASKRLRVAVKCML